MSIYMVVVPSFPTVWATAPSVGLAKAIAAEQLGMRKLPSGAIISKVN